MSWRERAIPVSAEGGDWKSRATPVGGNGMDVVDVAGASQAALEHYGNAATMGYLPHLQALVEKALPNPSADVDAQLRAKGINIVQPEQSYVESRDANIKRLEQQSKDFPKASLAGTGAGIIGGALLTGSAMGATKGATLAGRVLNSAKTGAILGGVANPGDTEGEMDPLQLGARVDNAKTGALVGAAAQGVLEAAGPLAKKASEYFKGKAGEKAVYAAGATKADMKRLGEKGSKALGNEALDQGVVGPLSTPGSVAKKTASMKEKVGESIGTLIKGADEAGAPRVDGAKIGLDLLDDPAIKAAELTPGGSSMHSAAVREAETLAKNGEMSLSDAHALRKRIDQAINFNKKRQDLPPGTQEVLYNIRDKINNALNESINSIQGNGADALKKANKAYSQLSRLEDMATNRTAMNSSNRTISLTDTIAAVGGGSAAGPLGALVVGALNKAGRTFGSGLQAAGFNAASKVAGRIPALSQYASNNAPSVQAMINRITVPGGQFQASDMGEIINNPILMKQFQKNPSLIESVQDEKLKAEIYKRIGRKPAENALQRRLEQ